MEDVFLTAIVITNALICTLQAICRLYEVRVLDKNMSGMMVFVERIVSLDNELRDHYEINGFNIFAFNKSMSMEYLIKIGAEEIDIKFYNKVIKKHKMAQSVIANTDGALYGGFAFFIIYLLFMSLK